MPGKKTFRTRKPVAKVAARKAPAARKAAKPAVRKPKMPAVRAKAAKPSRTKSRATARSAAPRPAAKPAKPAKAAAAAYEPAIMKPRIPASIAQVAEARPALAAIQPRLARRPIFAEEDDDSATGHNLLLGPRNVRPYRERKGEQYMGRDQLDHFRGILSNWKRDLMEEVDRTMTHMKDEAANPPDPNDRATLESEFALELRTRDRERKLIRKIEEALSRIEDGSYGYCVETGEPIGVKRLEARPVATLCIEAQERRERREKQYGDRDDWYR
ncbi:MAG TPA: RNA polymerase-binding protein DksA [Steroidobacteraceae bacterium]